MMPPEPVAPAIGPGGARPPGGHPAMTEQLIIAGERRDAAEGATFTVTEPATGKPLAEVAKASGVDVDLALASAHRAFNDGRGAWARTNATERGRVLHKVAELLREREDLFATAEAR